MHWLSASIQSRIETLAALTAQIDQTRETLVEIEETTWGARLREIDGGAVRGAAGGRAGQSALDRARVASLEGVERVRELYGQATGAADSGLREVVREFGREQRRHEGQVEASQRRVELLSALVTNLAQD